MPVTLVPIEDGERAPYVRRTAKGYEGARYWWVTTSSPGKAHAEAPLPQLGDPWDANLPTLIVSKVDVQYRVGPGVGSGGQDDAGRCLATVEYATPSDFGGGGNDPPPVPGTVYTEHADPISISQTYYHGQIPVEASDGSVLHDPNLIINNGDGVSVELHLPQFKVTSIHLGFPTTQVAKREILLGASYVNTDVVTLPVFRGSTDFRQLPIETAMLTAASWELSGTGNGGQSIYTLTAVVAYSPVGTPKFPGKWRTAWQLNTGVGAGNGITYSTRTSPATSWAGWL